MTGTTLPTEQSSILSITLGKTSCSSVQTSAQEISCVLSGAVEAGDHKPIVQTEMGNIAVSAAAQTFTGSIT